MAMWLNIILISFGLIVFTGGGVFILMYIFRPKKVIFDADVYMLGGGVKPSIKDKSTGKILCPSLCDIRPYTKDILVKITKHDGRIMYKLQRLNLPVQSLSVDTVENFGGNIKRVSVLIDGDNATLLKKGYDKKTGNMIFQPMPQDRINMMQQYMILKKHRLTGEATGMEVLSRMVLSAVAIIGLILWSYITASNNLAMSEINKETAIIISDSNEKVAGLYNEAFTNLGINRENLNSSNNMVILDPNNKPPLINDNYKP